VNLCEVVTPPTHYRLERGIQYVYTHSCPVVVVLEDSLYVYVLGVDAERIQLVTPELSNPTYTHGVHPKRTNPNRLSVYVPPANRKMVEECREALERDGSSLSAFMLEQLAKWWDLHKPGNPQTELSRYGIDPAAGPGPGIPKSVCYHDRMGRARWIWFRQLPKDVVTVVEENGAQRYMRLSEFLAKD